MKSKKIKFKKLNQKQYYYYFIPLSILGVFLIFYNPLNLGIREINLYAVILILIVFLVINDFFLPINIVEYNTNVIRIKINTIVKKSINIKDISSVIFTGNELHIINTDKSVLKFNLENINAQSRIELANLLKKLNHK